MVLSFTGSPSIRPRNALNVAVDLGFELDEPGAQVGRDLMRERPVVEDLELAVDQRVRAVVGRGERVADLAERRHVTECFTQRDVGRRPGVARARPRPRCWRATTPGSRRSRAAGDGP